MENVMKNEKEITSLMNKSNELSEAGKYNDAINLALQAWPLVTEKNRENGFYVWVIESLIGDYFQAKDYDGAERWAVELVKNKDSSEMPSGDYFWMGKIKFEKGELEQAYQWFEKAYQEDDLAFKGEPKKYLDFYLKKKKNG